MGTGTNPGEAVVETAWTQAPNLHADAVGSIHDEDQARRIGFRAAPIGANTRLAYYTPVIVALFGQAWHERGFLSLDFLTHFPSRFPERAVFKSALWGSIWLIALTGLFSFPLGVGAAI